LARFGCQRCAKRDCHRPHHHGRRQLPNRLTVSGVPSQGDGQGESQRSNLDVLAFCLDVRNAGAMVDRIPYARKLRHLPVVLSTDEVARFLAGVPNLKHRMALTMAYAAGLRVSEVVRLKIADIDSARMLLRVEQGKGGKDRYVMLIRSSSDGKFPIDRHQRRCELPPRFPPSRLSGRASPHAGDGQASENP
jgi:integrase